MGESVMEGSVIEWSKKIGDKVETDEILLEIATDKVDTEVPSPETGILVEILVQEDETVEVGQAIAVIETDADAAETAINNSNKSETADDDSQEDPQEEETKTVTQENKVEAKQ